MEMTNEQKLITLLLCDIHKKLGIDDSLDVGLISKAIMTGNDWAIDKKYEGQCIPTKTPPETTVKFVADVLEMWSFIEEAHAKLDSEQKAALAQETKACCAHVAFNGFDGNSECDYLSVADFFINKMGRFGDFASRNLNSHVPMVDTYSMMLEVFEPMRKELVFPRSLSFAELTAILKAKVHPDYCEFCL